MARYPKMDVTPNERWHRYYIAHREEVATRGKLRRGYFLDYAEQHKSTIKFKTRAALQVAVRVGQLVRGVCEVCRSSTVEAHHDDYNKPLDVRWLYTEHHGEVRRRQSELKEVSNES